MLVDFSNVKTFQNQSKVYQLYCIILFVYYWFQFSEILFKSFYIHVYERADL